MTPTPVRGRRFPVALLLVALVAGGGVWLAVTKGKVLAGETNGHKANPATPSVEVVACKAGGIDRLCTQPGTVEPFQSADIYAKVSGYLVEQTVDIGSVVKAGQVLARLAVPEYEDQVKKDEADVRRAKAKVSQAAAAIATAEADHRAASASVLLAKAEQKSKASYRAYRAKQRDRLRDLLADKAIDAKLVDEQEDQYEAAYGAELAAGEAVNAAKQKEAAAAARVEQSKADKATAEAEVGVADAQLERSKQAVEYAVIHSPYDGIVTYRKYHPGQSGAYGDYIRPADSGGDRTPMLIVERVDVMRLVVYVPDRDATFVNTGDAANVEIDALKDFKFEGPDGGKSVVSRIAMSQDPHSRMMKTEIHLRNPDGRLYSGMFGRVTINLQRGDPTAVRIPTTALVGKEDGKKAKVRVVRDGKVQTLPVTLGVDNGMEVEVMTGLAIAERVVVRSSMLIEDGTAVTLTTPDDKPSGH